MDEFLPQSDLYGVLRMLLRCAGRVCELVQESIAQLYRPRFSTC